MIGLLKSVLGVTTDVVKVAAAPVEIAVDLARSVTKPIADLGTETAKSLKEITNPEK